MSSRALLPEAEQDVRDEVVRLRREIAGLEQELATAKQEVSAAKQGAADALSAIRALRHSLEPFYKALRMVFGEISRVDAIGNSETAQPSSGLSPKLEMMKTRLGGRQAEFITLLAHGPMTTAQLAAVAKCHRDTVSQVVHKLTKAGVINKNGGKFSLREI